MQSHLVFHGRHGQSAGDSSSVFQLADASRSLLAQSDTDPRPHGPVQKRAGQDLNRTVYPLLMTSLYNPCSTTAPALWTPPSCPRRSPTISARHTTGKPVPMAKPRRGIQARRRDAADSFKPAGGTTRGPYGAMHGCHEPTPPRNAKLVSRQQWKPSVLQLRHRHVTRNLFRVSSGNQAFCSSDTERVRCYEDRAVCHTDTEQVRCYEATTEHATVHVGTPRLGPLRAAIDEPWIFAWVVPAWEGRVTRYKSRV